MSFVELTQKYQLFKYDFFRFLQLRHYITKNTTHVSNCEISSIERLLFLSSGKMSLGRFYDALCLISSADTQRIKTKWEEELATDIDDETWDDIWSYAKEISVCTHTREIQFKIIHRLHISPNRRHSFNPSISPLCLKRKTEVGTLTHCLWSCDRFLVLREMERVFNMQLDSDPVSLVLGIPN